MTTGPSTIPENEGSEVSAEALSTSAEHFTIYFNATPEGDWVAWNWTLSQAILDKADRHGTLWIEILPLLNDRDDLTQFVFMSFSVGDEATNANSYGVRTAGPSVRPEEPPPEEGGEPYDHPMWYGHGYLPLRAAYEGPQAGDRYLLIAGAVADETKETAIHFRVIDPDQVLYAPTEPETLAAREEVFANVLPNETRIEPAATGKGVYYGTYFDMWEPTDEGKEVFRYWSDNIEPSWTLGPLDTPSTLDRGTRFTMSYGLDGFVMMNFIVIGEPGRATDLHFRGDVQGTPVDLETRNPVHGTCTMECLPPETLLRAEIAALGQGGIHLEFDSTTRGVLTEMHHVATQVMSLGADPGAISGRPVVTFTNTNNNDITDV